jgi:Flp pilus assembly protein TadG
MIIFNRILTNVRAPSCLSRFINGGDDGVRGVAAIEFSIVAPLLVLMLVGTIDAGTAIYRKMQVQNAVHAGAQYAMFNGFNASGITTAITSASNGSINSSPAPQQFCGCPSMAGVAMIDCSSICPDGSNPGSYVTISAQVNYSTLFQYPLIPGQLPINAQATVRVQ